MPFIQLQFRRGTASEWSSAVPNPVLAAGEMGIETDTNQFKIGDGVLDWNALPYGGLQGPAGSVGSDIAVSTLFVLKTLSTSSTFTNYTSTGQLLAGIMDFSDKIKITQPLPQSIAIGYNNGLNQDIQTIAIGAEAGRTLQKPYSIAIGTGAGYTQQDERAVALGANAGYAGQAEYAIAIGDGVSEYVSQGANSVGIGRFAGRSQFNDSTIILNATGADLPSDKANAFYVAPVATRTNAGLFSTLYYDDTTKEVFAGPIPAGGGGSVASNIGFSNVNILDTLITSSTFTNYLSGSTIQAFRINYTNPAVALGSNAATNPQGDGAIAIGTFAGGTQSQNAIAIGASAGNGQQLDYSVALGFGAANLLQYDYSIAIGFAAGATQQTNSIAIGTEAGRYTQDSNAIAIGYKAGFSNQSTHTIVFNANDTPLYTTKSNALFVAPIATRVGAQTFSTLYYDADTKEVFAGDLPTGGASLDSNIGFSNVNILDTLSTSSTFTNYTSTGQLLAGIMDFVDKIRIQQPLPQSIAIGWNSGFNQALQTIAIGAEAGRNLQDSYSIAVGTGAGYDRQDERAIAIGANAGRSIQSTQSIAIGSESAWIQEDETVAIGAFAARAGQKSYSIAIGSSAGRFGQSTNAIAIGRLAAYEYQSTNTIVLNATGNALNTTKSDALFLAPVASRSDPQNFSTLYYDDGTKEVFAGPPGGSAVVASNIGFSNVNILDTLSTSSTFTNYTSTGQLLAGIMDFSDKIKITQPLPQSIAIGYNNGLNQDIQTIAIGAEAGRTLQKPYSIAIGTGAGYTQQNERAVALGANAGYAGQAEYAIAIGDGVSEFVGQGANSVGIGRFAGRSQFNDSTIILNATGADLPSDKANAFYVAPVATRTNAGLFSTLYYDDTTKEVFAGPVPAGGGSVASNIGFSNVNILDTLSTSSTFTNFISAQSLQISTIGFVYDIILNNTSGVEANIAIGTNVGSEQLGGAIAIGIEAGQKNQDGGIAIGTSAGQSNQQVGAIAIGTFAGQSNQQVGAIAIGGFAGYENQSTQTIVLNASGATLNTTKSNAFFVAPIAARGTYGTHSTLFYDEATNEVFAGPVPSGGGSISSNYAFSNLLVADTLSTISTFTEFLSAPTAFVEDLNVSTITFPVNIVLTTPNNKTSVQIGRNITGTATNSVAIGVAAGVEQGNQSVAIGSQAGGTSQSSNAIAIGSGAGLTSQATATVAIGLSAGFDTQKENSVAIGFFAGQKYLGSNAVAIGFNALANDISFTNPQGMNNVAIGAYASQDPQGYSNTVVLNAQGSALNPDKDSAFYIAPVATRTNAGLFSTLYYDDTTKEVFAGPIPAGGASLDSNIGFSNVNILDTLSTSSTFTNYLSAATVYSQFTQVSTLFFSTGKIQLETNTLAAPISIGYQSGSYAQGQGIAIGDRAGQSNQQTGAIAIGSLVGRSNQQNSAIAIGDSTALNDQGQFSIAIGSGAGVNIQNSNAIAIGQGAGHQFQDTYTVAIGTNAGRLNQSSFAVAIGYAAGSNNQSTNTIVLNASGVGLDTTKSNAFFVAPIATRVGAQTFSTLYYDADTKEVFAGDLPTGAASLNSNIGFSNVNILDTLSTSSTFTNYISAGTMQVSTVFALYTNVTTVLEASTLNTNHVSAGTAQVSSLQLVDPATAGLSNLYVESGALYFAGSAVGGGSVASNIGFSNVNILDTLSTSSTFTNYLSAATAVMSTLTVDSLTVVGSNTFKSYGTSFLYNTTTIQNISSMNEIVYSNVSFPWFSIGNTIQFSNKTTTLNGNNLYVYVSELNSIPWFQLGTPPYVFTSPGDVFSVDLSFTPVPANYLQLSNDAGNVLTVNRLNDGTIGQLPGGQFNDVGLSVNYGSQSTILTSNSLYTTNVQAAVLSTQAVYTSSIGLLNPSTGGQSNLYVQSGNLYYQGTQLNNTLKTGSAVTNGASNTTINFAQPFPNAITSVIATYSNADTTLIPPLRTSSWSVNGFSVYGDANSEFGWVAFGY